MLLPCVGGTNDGNWVEVPLERLRCGDRWQVREPAPLSTEWTEPDAAGAVKAAVMRVDVYRMEHLRFNTNPALSTHEDLWFLVETKISTIDATLMVFRSYCQRDNQ